MGPAPAHAVPRQAGRTDTGTPFIRSPAGEVCGGRSPQRRSRLKTIREIAKKYTPEQIESCIITQLETGENACLRDEAHEKIVNDLAKAAFIKTLMTEKGLSLADALRELARRMRRIQSHAKRHPAAAQKGGKGT